MISLMQIVTCLYEEDSSSSTTHLTSRLENTVSGLSSTSMEKSAARLTFQMCQKNKDGITVSYDSYLILNSLDNTWRHLIKKAGLGVGVPLEDVKQYIYRLTRYQTIKFGMKYDEYVKFKEEQQELAN